MYFWRINRLKQELIEQPLEEKTALHYFLGFMLVNLFGPLIQSLVSLMPLPSWYFIYLALILFISLFGIYFSFKAHEPNTDFLKRFVAIAWVMTCRCLVFGLIIFAVGIFIIELFSQQRVFQAAHYWWLAVFVLTWLVCFYWRISCHLSSLN